MAARGELYDVKGEFRDATTLALIAPTAVTLSIRSPALVTTVPAVMIDGLGLYRVRVNLNAVGTWTFRWSSTGTGQAATPDFTILVEETVFP